jgi:hypothetical protein
MNPTASGNQELNKTHPAGSSGNCRHCFFFEKKQVAILMLSS